MRGEKATWCTRHGVQNSPMRREIIQLSFHLSDGAANGTQNSNPELGSLFPFRSLFNSDRKREQEVKELQKQCKEKCIAPGH